MVGGLCWANVYPTSKATYVGPTKYGAVGPTEKQWLGFGWRMVSVLAGLCEVLRLFKFPSYGEGFTIDRRITLFG